MIQRVKVKNTVDVVELTEEDTKQVVALVSVVAEEMQVLTSTGHDPGKVHAWSLGNARI